MADVVTHTPGQWIARREVYHGTVLVDVLTIDGNDVCSLNNPDDQVAMADAHLIAAAPELLAACERALSFLDTDVPYGPEQPIFQQLAGAIKKARE